MTRALFAIRKINRVAKLYTTLADGHTINAISQFSHASVCVLLENDRNHFAMCRIIISYKYRFTQRDTYFFQTRRYRVHAVRYIFAQFRNAHR